MRSLIIRLGIILLVGSWTWGVSLAAAPSKNASKSADLSISQARVPVKIFGGFLVVAEGQFGDTLQHQNFVLDTGTSPSILNLKVARQLRLPLSEARLAAVGRESKTMAATVPELRLGPLQADSVTFLVSDLSAVERDLKVSIAGILGMDILGRSSFRLDYQNQTLEFGEIAPEGIPIGLSTRADLPIAEVRIDGKLLRLLVDTGSDRLVFFGNKAAAQFSARAAGDALKGNSVASALPVHDVSSLELELNGERFRQKAYIVPGSEEDLFDGLLSVRSMGIRALSLDARHRVVYLLK